jgi:hypothetical protein
MKLLKLVKAMMRAAALVAIVVGLCLFEMHVTPKKIPETQLHLRKIQFVSDGTITGRWLARALAIKRNILLSEIDVFAIKERLLSFSQIRNVCVEKRFPDFLAIKINERHPLLKFAIRNGDGTELLFVDSQDGTIFAAACMPKSLILAIPYVDLKIEKSRDSPTGLMGVDNIGMVSYLVNTLKTQYPEIYEQIRKFSLVRYDCRSGADWSRIEIILKNGTTVAFNPQHIDNQLINLDYLMSEHGLSGARVKKIDLAKINSVIVENE